MKLSALLLLSLAITSVGCSKGATTEGTSTGSSTSASADPELEVVREIVAKQMQVPKSQLADDVPIGKMKPPLDELDVVEIIMELEDHFKITIPDKAIALEEGKVANSPMTLKSFVKIVRDAKKAH